MTNLILWLWPVVVAGTVIAVGLFAIEQDRRRRRRNHPKPGE